jgi:phosphotriesterase-related protein
MGEGAFPRAERSEAHVRSGKVMTVLGPVPAGSLGVTLMHEHILNDCRCWWNLPTEPERQHLATESVHAGIIGELRMDPFVNLHNCALDDEPLAVDELGAFARQGGRTVVDPTCRGIGRDPNALARISRVTGLQIVMGAGYYLQSSHPAAVRSMSADAIADEIVAEALEGVDGSGIRIGLIGEIGVSSDFTAEEEKSLRGASRAHRRTGLPLMVHLPGWFRHGHRVLDVVEEEGGNLRHTVLCHLNPSGHDRDYQTGLGARGAFLEYDMIGMDYFYADQGVQCPSDDDNARAIKGLVDAGLTDRILLSHDVFLKMMLTRYGGFGYGYVTRHFLPRLRRFGVSDDEVATMMTANPRSVFEGACPPKFVQEKR